MQIGESIDIQFFTSSNNRNKPKDSMLFFFIESKKNIGIPSKKFEKGRDMTVILTSGY
jgi:hypothetical protein